MEREYSQATYPTKDSYLEYIKNSQKPTVKAQTAQLENRQKKHEQNKYDLQIVNKHMER